MNSLAGIRMNDIKNLMTLASQFTNVNAVIDDYANQAKGVSNKFLYDLTTTINTKTDSLSTSVKSTVDKGIENMSNNLNNAISGMNISEADKSTLIKVNNSITAITEKVVDKAINSGAALTKDVLNQAVEVAIKPSINLVIDNAVSVAKGEKSPLEAQAAVTSGVTVNFAKAGIAIVEDVTKSVKPEELANSIKRSLTQGVMSAVVNSTIKPSSTPNQSHGNSQSQER